MGKEDPTTTTRAEIRRSVLHNRNEVLALVKYSYLKSIPSSPASLPDFSLLGFLSNHEVRTSLCHSKKELETFEHQVTLPVDGFYHTSNYALS
ncbi:hypothetical protein PAXRUDRAFT_529495 [Paxillus rubicundulus Ve08.2h10]|uniref:Uncharacterized protein n=1 Tax=Paxillus rubicundulus Ve08.2h10 TaxID=930991 RepID=A0A0D0E673_9AGAM|nr:hypothetical protein PAXRUDRAFT_529495 [Paxillus rubicundulus Ve08.2h10]